MEIMPQTTASSREQTISTPPADILRLLLLQYEDDVTQAFRKYNYREARGIDQEPNKIIANLKALWSKIRISYYYHNKKEHDTILLLLKSEDVNDLEEAFIFMQRFLYDKKVTQFDGRKKIDTTNMEEENLAKGL